MIRRRDALKLGLGAGVAAALSPGAFAAHDEFGVGKIPRLTIAPIEVELAPGVCVRSIAFDGIVPGPQLIRGAALKALELRNDTDSDTVIHSPALAPALLTLPARSRARALLRAPESAATARNLTFYRAYCAAGGAVASGAVVDGVEHEGISSGFDQLQVLSIHRWSSHCTGQASRSDIHHPYASFNDKLMSASQPIRVRHGDRVRFHFSNPSATHGLTLGLPEHRFLVVALDGYSVPTPRSVERLYIGPAESVDAIVAMERPGRWILGATNRDDRIGGLGRLIEYAGAAGTPVQADYGLAEWDYTDFGLAMNGTAPSKTPLAAPPLWFQSLPAVDASETGFSDSTPYAQTMPLQVATGSRYRLAVLNVTREPQSLQLLNHIVELVSVAGRRTAGVRKDVVTLPSFTRVEFEFLARAQAVLLAYNRHVRLEETRLQIG